MKHFLIITLGLSALIVALSISYYLVIFLPEINKEKVQQENLKLKQDQALQQQKKDQDQRDYINKRKSECYSIYQKEKSSWNNVEGYGYVEENDKCIVRYTTDDYKGVDCDKEYKGLSSLNLECKMGIFTKTF